MYRALLKKGKGLPGAGAESSQKKKRGVAGVRAGKTGLLGRKGGGGNQQGGKRRRGLSSCAQKKGSCRILQGKKKGGGAGRGERRNGVRPGGTVSFERKRRGGGFPFVKEGFRNCPRGGGENPPPIKGGTPKGVASDRETSLGGGSSFGDLLKS